MCDGGLLETAVPLVQGKNVSNMCLPDMVQSLQTAFRKMQQRNSPVSSLASEEPPLALSSLPLWTGLVARSGSLALAPSSRLGTVNDWCKGACIYSFSILLHTLTEGGYQVAKIFT